VCTCIVSEWLSCSWQAPGSVVDCLMIHANTEHEQLPSSHHQSLTYHLHTHCNIAAVSHFALLTD